MVFESIRVPIVNPITLIILIINIIKTDFGLMNKNLRRKFFQSFDKNTCYDALIVAIKMDYKNVVVVLINRHEWIEDEDTLLTMAITNGHLRIVDYIINLSKSFCFNLDSLVKKDETAVSIAIMSGNPKMVQHIINTYGNWNLYNDPLLIKATMCGHPKIVRQLINAGQFVESRDNEGNNALFYAILNNNMEIFTILIEAIEDPTELRRSFELACEKRNPQVITMLINAGLDKITQQRALGRAIRRRKSDMVELLLNAGATPSEHHIRMVVNKMDKHESLILEKATDDVKTLYKRNVLEDLLEKWIRKHMASLRIHRFWRDVKYNPEFAHCSYKLKKICDE